MVEVFLSFSCEVGATNGRWFETKRSSILRVAYLLFTKLAFLLITEAAQAPVRTLLNGIVSSNQVVHVCCVLQDCLVAVVVVLLVNLVTIDWRVISVLVEYSELAIRPDKNGVYDEGNHHTAVGQATFAYSGARTCVLVLPNNIGGFVDWTEGLVPKALRL